MKIATFNINSVRGRLPRLLEWLGEAQPDVVCLQELRIFHDECPVETIRDAGYGALWQGQKPRYNGIAILARGADPVEMSEANITPVLGHGGPGCPCQTLLVSRSLPPALMMSEMNALSTSTADGHAEYDLRGDAMPQTPHVETHFTSSKKIRDIDLPPGDVPAARLIQGKRAGLGPARHSEAHRGSAPTHFLNDPVQWPISDGSTTFIDSAVGFGHSVKGFFTNLFSN